MLGWAPLLALQLLVAGLGVGAHAASAKVDFFGNVICSAEGEAVHRDGGAPSPERSHVPNCCSFGCSQSGSGTLLPPVAADGVPARAALQQAVLYPAADGLPAASSRTPHNPRAPPGMI